MVTDEGNSLIEQEYIKAFLAREEWEPDPHKAIRQVFITCDPCGSGQVQDTSTSEMSLVAVAPIYSERVVSVFFFNILAS